MENVPQKRCDMHVYIKSESQQWTVGFYSPSGEWRPESDHYTRGDAAKRAHYLNLLFDTMHGKS